MFQVLLSVRAQLVQLFSGAMHEPSRVGKNASMGKSIWLNSSQGLCAASTALGVQDFVGMQ